jgi:hypothetical protein
MYIAKKIRKLSENAALTVMGVAIGGTAAAIAYDSITAFVLTHLTIACIVLFKSR